MFKKVLCILFILSFSSYAAASQLAITDGECGDYGAMVLYGDVVDDDSCDAMVPYEPKPRQQGYRDDFKVTFESMRQAEEEKLNNFWQNLIDAIKNCKRTQDTVEKAQSFFYHKYYTSEYAALNKSKFKNILTLSTETYMKLIDAIDYVVRDTTIDAGIKDTSIVYADILLTDFAACVKLEKLKINPQYAYDYVDKIINIKRYCDSGSCELALNNYSNVVTIPECLYEAYSRTRYGKLDIEFQKYLKDYKNRQDELGRVQQENDNLKLQNEQLQIEYNNLLERAKKGPIIEEVD